MAAVDRAAERYPQVHRVAGPTQGPTTKAGNLNAIYSALRRAERQSGERYEIIVVHDAEDIIHPLSLLGSLGRQHRHAIVGDDRLAGRGAHPLQPAAGPQGAGDDSAHVQPAARARGRGGPHFGPFAAALGRRAAGPHLHRQRVAGAR